MDLDPERVASDPLLRQVLETARSWGVSPSRFTGREPGQTLIRSTGGQVVRVMPDPEWTEQDQGLALALAAYEASLCPGCHHPLAETTLAENSYAYEAAGAPHRCHRCTAREIAAGPYGEQPQAGALLYRIELNPVAVERNRMMIRLEAEQAEQES